jgi:hypothetical protein
MVVMMYTLLSLITNRPVALKAALCPQVGCWG